MADDFTTPDGRRLAYNRTPGRGPGVVFLGGFVSDMEGTKALALEAWAQARGRAFLRFDYSGHGQSSGNFEDGCIGDWFADTRAAIMELTDGPQVLVGSSMGGWISLLCAREMPEHLAGLVTIAAAPDFTEDLTWEDLTDAHRTTLMETGRVEVLSEYSEDGYVITRHLIEDGRNHLVLRSPLHLPMPVRFLQGTADADVPQSVAERLLAHATGDDLRLTLVKGADHRFSTPDMLALVEHTLDEVLVRIGEKNA
jgi:pimeloyl-ACP methyl ester carboxylesterase